MTHTIYYTFFDFKSLNKRNCGEQNLKMNYANAINCMQLTKRCVFNAIN